MIWLLIILALIAYPIIGVFCMFSLWVKFAALFAIEKLQYAGTIDPMIEKAGQVLYLRGKVFDAFCNTFFAWMIFGEWPWPKEWMVTGRIQRLVDGPEGWRKERAIWWASKAINPLCREPHIHL